jgi:carbon storage regulator CsrA
LLVLHRRVEQEVLIRVPGRDEPIVVSVLEVGRTWVKLGFAAGADVRILRKELEGREGEKERRSDENQALSHRIGDCADGADDGGRGVSGRHWAAGRADRCHTPAELV